MVTVSTHNRALSDERRQPDTDETAEDGRGPQDGNSSTWDNAVCGSNFQLAHCCQDSM